MKEQKVCYNCKSKDGYLRIGKHKLRCYICNNWKESEGIIEQPLTKEDFTFVTTNGCNVTNSKVVWRYRRSSHQFIIYRKMINSYKTSSGAEYKRTPHFLLQYIQTIHGKEYWFNSPDMEILIKLIKWIIKHRVKKPYLAKKIDIVKHFHFLKKVFEHGSYTAVANVIYPDTKRDGANIRALSIGNVCKRMGLYSKLTRSEGRLANELIIKENTPAHWFFNDLLDIGIK